LFFADNVAYTVRTDRPLVRYLLVFVAEDGVQQQTLNYADSNFGLFTKFMLCFNYYTTHT